MATKYIKVLANYLNHTFYIAKSETFLVTFDVEFAQKVNEHGQKEYIKNSVGYIKMWDNFPDWVVPKSSLTIEGLMDACPYKVNDGVMDISKAEFDAIFEAWIQQWRGIMQMNVQNKLNF
jgi:hypothetical protein